MMILLLFLLLVLVFSVIVSIMGGVGTRNAPTQEEFRDECRRAFAYLVEDYGFVEQPADPDARFLVRFASASVTIVIRGLSWGKWTVVYFNPVDPSLQRRKNYRYDDDYGYNLQSLFAIRKPDFPIRDFNRSAMSLFLRGFLLPRLFPLYNHQRLQIPRYAAALREVGTDILRGDFSVLPDVKIQEAKRWKRLKKGISPEALADDVSETARTEGPINVRHLHDLYFFTGGCDGLLEIAPGSVVFTARSHSFALQREEIVSVDQGMAEIWGAKSRLTKVPCIEVDGNVNGKRKRWRFLPQEKVSIDQLVAPFSGPVPGD